MYHPWLVGAGMGIEYAGHRGNGGGYATRVAWRSAPRRREEETKRTRGDRRGKEGWEMAGLSLRCGGFYICHEAEWVAVLYLYWLLVEKPGTLGISRIWIAKSQSYQSMLYL